MKRRVIQIANSTQLISLPRKWTQKYDIKKGDELEIEEQGNKISVSTEKVSEEKSIEIDITGLDRTTILYYIQNLYRAGYDQIRINFREPMTKHLRKEDQINIITVIHKEVNRLVGYEIIEQKENSCIIRDISKPTQQEYNSVIRRVFLLVIDTSSDFLKGLKNMDISLIETIEEKHDSVTKFVSYCLRLLNKFGHLDYNKTAILYHIVATFDRMVDVFKYLARELIYKKITSLNKKSIHIFELINESIKLFSETFFKYDSKKIAQIYYNRNVILNYLKNPKNDFSKEEIAIITKASQTMELLLEMSVSKLGIIED